MRPICNATDTSERNTMTPRFCNVLVDAKRMQEKFMTSVYKPIFRGRPSGKHAYLGWPIETKLEGLFAGKMIHLEVAKFHQLDDNDTSPVASNSYFDDETTPTVVRGIDIDTT